jgi:hypothetical protein
VGYGRGLSLPQYQDTLQQNGFVCQHYAIQTQPIQFYEWIAPAQLSPVERLRLQALIIQAPTPALESLTPQIAGDRITFYLQEILIIGRKRSIQ